MKRLLDRRPTPATVIASIALFVALGGVSYGFATGSIDSREIADGSIRSRDVRNDNLTSADLRNNRVLAIDVRNRTLRGRDIGLDTLTDDEIDESKLRQVPSAADAARLGGLAATDYVTGPEPVRLVGGSGQPPFQGGATAAGSPDLAPGFWKDDLDVVHLQGAVTGPVGGGVIFTLPGGYRPAGRVRFAVPVAGGAATTTVTVESDGSVESLAADPHLDGVTFRAP